MISAKRCARVALLPVVLLLAGCNSISEPDGKPMLTGTVVARHLGLAFGESSTIHVKQSASDQCGIIFTINSKTKIIRHAASGKLFKASETELTIGSQVSVWADLVLESCPGQSTADAVELFEPAD